MSGMTTALAKFLALQKAGQGIALPLGEEVAGRSLRPAATHALAGLAGAGAGAALHSAASADEDDIRRDEQEQMLQDDPEHSAMLKRFLAMHNAGR